MKVFTLKNKNDLYSRHDTFKHISDRIKVKVTEIYESPISFSFRVFDISGKETLSFWQYLKPMSYDSFRTKTKAE